MSLVRLVGQVDFDPGPNVFNLTSNGDDDIVVSELDKFGNLVWANSMGGTDRDQGHGIATDSSGNIFVTGEFRGTDDFNSGSEEQFLTSSGEEDFFITMLKSDREFVWGNGLGGFGDDAGRDITVDRFNNVYITGSFSNTIDFDPTSNVANRTSNGVYDIFITKWVKKHAPRINADKTIVSLFSNNTSATNIGTVSDLNLGDVVTLTASVGSVVDNHDGTWSWSFVPVNGTADSQTVTITATDSSGLQSEISFVLTVDKVLYYVEDFNDELAGFFEPNNINQWAIVDQQYQVGTSNNGGLGISLVNADSILPSTFEISSKITTVSGPNRRLDGFIIFDYKSETDFKYAGFFTGQNQWVIGHYQGHWGSRLAEVAWDDSGRSINANQAYT